ncbi:hypothetical protein [Methylogaea oryzae]|uniref:hypothetical protein n=1 Tax=Methylogaea oryzae TaxID=1295382 RepID=UPI0012E29FEB|nr:hypothetical protein [Methylogaea oryzae]
MFLGAGDDGDVVASAEAVALKKSVPDRTSARAKPAMRRFFDGVASVAALGMLGGFGWIERRLARISLQ